MKTTPFQQALKNELARLEKLSHAPSMQNYSLIRMPQAKPTKSRHFLLHFFKYTLSF